jgi:hypothetical protein
MFGGFFLWIAFPHEHRYIYHDFVSLNRYTNKVSVEPRVYKNLKLFMENKDGDDELFDRLTVRKHHKYSLFFIHPNLSFLIYRQQVLINI